jgi:hypothetical protein
MVTPVPNKVDGNVLYSTDLFKLLYANPFLSNGSIAIEGNKVASGLMIDSDWMTSATVGVYNHSGCAYLLVGSTQSPLPAVASKYITTTGTDGDNNHVGFNMPFSMKYFTSGLNFAGSVWIAVSGVNFYYQGVTPEYLTVWGV